MKYLGMLYNLNANVHNKIVWWAYGMLITFIHALLFRLANKIIKTNKFSFPVCQTRGQLLFSFTRLGFVCEWYFNFLKSAPLTISRVSETSVLAQISPRKIFFRKHTFVAGLCAWPNFVMFSMSNNAGRPGFGHLCDHFIQIFWSQILSLSQNCNLRYYT